MDLSARVRGISQKLHFPIFSIAYADACHEARRFIGFVDDDSVASYFLTLSTDQDYILDLPTVLDSTNGSTKLAGARGSRIQFKIGASTSLRTNDYLFTVLGNTGTEVIGSMAAADYKFIDSTLSIIGQTTGYRLDIAVRYVKKI